MRPQLAPMTYIMTRNTAFSRALQLAPMLAGTLISAGVGYLVLFRTNRSARENAVFLVMMYVIGAGWGLILSAFGL